MITDKVNKLPDDIEDGDIYNLVETKSRKLTHNFVRYPCTFIPRIPEWAIEKYAKDGKAVLDPFAGSGTSLVESSFRGYKSYGADFDKLSQLLTKTKTTPLSTDELSELTKFKNKVYDQLPSNKRYKEFIPELDNLEHWFPEESIRDLSKIKMMIDSSNLNEREINVLKTSIADITKEVSNADPASPKPYVSNNIDKEPKEVKAAFNTSLENKINKISNFSEKTDSKPAEIISNDARDIPKPDTPIGLAITSPPYINAFDYVRCLKLENIWLDFIDPDKTNDKKKDQIGHEKVYADQYNSYPEDLEIEEADKVIQKIYEDDKKRGHVVKEFFTDMETNLETIYDLLAEDGRYVIVIGKNEIRGNEVDTPKILTKLADRVGFETELQFGYVLKNKYVGMSRNGKGGDIDTDHIIVLKKN